MPKQNMMLAGLSFLFFCLAGALIGLLVYMLGTPLWYLGAVYAGVAFLALLCLVLTIVCLNTLLDASDGG